MKVARSIEIGAPPSQVWPLLVEPEKIRRWWTALESFEFDGEPRGGVGARFRCEERVLGKFLKARFDFVITEWQPERRLTFSMTSGDALKACDESWTLTPTDSGTLFTFEEEIALPFGVLGKAFAGLGRWQVGAKAEKMLAALKSLAEPP